MRSPTHPAFLLYLAGERCLYGESDGNICSVESVVSER